MADGYGFGAEGDWKTAALGRVLKVMGTGLRGGASFMEDYTYHLDPRGPKVLGAHMLEICPSLAGDRPACEIHPLGIGGKSDPVRLTFAASQGPALNVAMIDLGDRFRLVANEVDGVAPDHPLPNLPVARLLDAAAESENGRRRLDLRRRAAPHGSQPSPDLRAHRGLRRNARSRVPADRCGNATGRNQESTSLERGVL